MTMTSARRIGCALLLGVALVGTSSRSMRADQPRTPQPEPTRWTGSAVEADGVARLRAGFDPPGGEGGVARLRARFDPHGSEGGVAGGTCPAETTTHTDFNFESGSVILQQGFAENEIAAASFLIPDEEFPIIVRTAEMVFAQSHSNQTETHWSFLVWDGPPNGGALVAEYSSDGSILPHLTMPAQGGATAVNIAVTVDPGDPDQILITNEGGSNLVTIGYRIDQHNNQVQDPCVFAPPAGTNAFPTTDVGGLAEPQHNWIRAIDCGPFGCPDGWRTFSQLGPCQPSGDWIMRLTYEPTGCAPGACCLPEGGCEILDEPGCTFSGGVFQGSTSACDVTCPQPGACCLPDGSCSPSSLVGGEDCVLAEGIYLGDDTSCDTAECPDAVGACCFSDGSCTDGLSDAQCITFDGIWQGAQSLCDSGCSIEGACCFPDDSCVTLNEQQCGVFEGVFQGVGSDCGTVVCNPSGACCLPEGSCLEAVSPDDCVARGGTFQGDGISCQEASCPQPLGACCAASGGCAELLEETCISIPNAEWGGPFTTCDDGNANGEPDGCEPSCPADVDQSGVIDVDDLVTVLLAWGESGGSADVDGSGLVDVDDLLAVILAWGPC